MPDPSKATGTEAEQLAVYRQVGDQILNRIEREPELGCAGKSASPARLPPPRRDSRVPYSAEVLW